MSAPIVLAEKGDVSDWLADGGSATRLRTMIETTMPWERPKPEDGAAVLDSVAALLGRFVAFPNTATCHAVTLWIAHTHLMSKWDVTPRLNIYSAEKRSGKTRLLELVGLLVPNPIHTNNASVAALQRLAADGENLPTLLVDEADAIFGAKTAAQHEDLRSFLNSGWARGVDAIRCESTGRKFEVVRYSSFCAVALAGIGQLPDTITDRAIDAHMRRRAPGERVERYRRRIEEKHGHALRDRLAAWARVVEPNIGNPWPELPQELEDRAADAWEPLVAVADAAGGEWPARARMAASGSAVESEEDQTENVRLLADVRTIFTNSGADALFGETIIQRLTTLAESPWAEISYGKPLNARGLSQRLKAYGVKSQTLRLKEETRRGYRRADFADAWNRYLTPAASSETSATRATNHGNASNDAGNSVAYPDSESATVVQHDETHDAPFSNVAQQLFGSATENPSNHADVAHVAHVADVPSKRDTGDTFAHRLNEMPTGELSDEEREAINRDSKPSRNPRPADDARHCVDCGALVQMRGLDRCDVCVQAHYERNYGANFAAQREPLFAAGEPGLDRHSR